MWGVIPIQVRRNMSLSDKAKLLYCEITDNTNEKGKCTKDNNFFAECLGVTPTTARRYLYELRDMELVCVEEDGDRVITFPEKLVIVDGASSKSKKSQNLRRDLAEKVVDIWNEKVAKRGIRVSPPLLQMVTSRSKNFSDEEILTAVKNRAKFVTESDWHNQPENIHHRNNIHLVIRSDKELERHLNMEVKSNSGDTNSIKVFKF